MSLFDHLLEVAVEHPIITGAGAAFFASVPAALLGQMGLAVLLVFAGVLLGSL